jgi:hippurate hydrolase
VVNTPREAELAWNAGVRVVGERGMVRLEHPSMGGEDFSYYLEHVPGCYVRFGARGEGHEYVPLHSPSFDIDEGVLKVGAAFFDQLARDAACAYGP